MSATMITKTQSDAEVSVDMSQTAILEAPQLGRTVLGSCIGLVLYDPTAKIGAMSHIVLAKRLNRSGPPGKFADSAVPHMLELLVNGGARTPRVVAKLAGGASMFGGGGPIQIGEANRLAVRELLESHKIPILGEHVGGPKGRRVTFDSSTGVLTIEIVGESPVEL